MLISHVQSMVPCIPQDTTHRRNEAFAVPVKPEDFGVRGILVISDTRISKVTQSNGWVCREPCRIWVSEKNVVWFDVLMNYDLVLFYARIDPCLSRAFQLDAGLHESF